MSCIVYRKNKKSGIVYAYRQESYRDPISKKPRNTRTYLGKVDPETNTIIEKKERGSKNTSEASENHDLTSQIQKLQKLIDSRDKQILRLTEELKEKDKTIQSMNRLLDKISGLTAADMRPV